MKRGRRRRTAGAGNGRGTLRWPGWGNALLALFLVAAALACGRGGAATPPPSGGAPGSGTANAVPAVAASGIASLPRVTSGSCRMALPAGFTEDRLESGYYPERNRLGFAALDSLDAPSLDAAAQSLGNELQAVIADYQETQATKAQDAYRVDFTGTIDGRPGTGTSYLSQVGPATCGITLFLLPGSSVQAEAALRTMIASLQTVEAASTAAGAATRPPAPPATTAPTAAPRTAASTPAGWQVYRGERVPLDAAYPPGWNVLDEEQVRQATGRQVAMPLVSFTPPQDPAGYSGVTIVYSPTTPVAYGSDAARLAADSVAALRQEACPGDSAAQVSGPQDHLISGIRFSRYDLRCTVRGEVMTLIYLVALPGDRTWIVTLGGRGTVQDPDYTGYLFPILDTVRLR